MARKIGIYLLTLLTVLSVFSLGSASAQVKRAVARESVDAPALPTALDLERARLEARMARDRRPDQDETSQRPTGHVTRTGNAT